MKSYLTSKGFPCGVVLLFILCGVISQESMGQKVIFEKPLSPRIANYDIKVTLDDVNKRITGDIILTWNNPSDDHIDELPFHLYANGFKNNKSTFLRETLQRKSFGEDGKDPGKTAFDKEIGWGGIRVTHMEVDGEYVTEKITFSQPDDNNKDDQTVMLVTLSKPIAPRATATIRMEFEVQIQQCKIRTGWWQDDFFMMAHWFPKIGVYETPGMRFVPDDAPHGQWNCHQFHSGTEFYSDFGVYDVQITLPEKYVVGVSGLIVEVKKHEDGTKTIIAHAEDIHGFAWVADAQFLEANEVWKNPEDGREIAIRLLYQPDNTGVVDKYIDSLKGALDHVHTWLGPDAYPYPNVTVVDPRAGSGAGGMEYPTLFTGGAKWRMEKIFGDGFRMVEGVTIHEFMHEIWYGIVATNEFEEAWMDEGLTTYSTSRIANELFDGDSFYVDFWGAKIGAFGMHQASYSQSTRINDGSIADHTYAHWHRNIGLSMAYDKPSLMLATLENYLGRERFDNIMRTYYQKWKFRHPGRDDFIAVANEVAGENLDWFFDQVLHQASSLDYAVASIANVPLEDFEKGILGDELKLPEDDEEEDGKPDEHDDAEVEDEESEEDGPYQSTVVFRRVGEVEFPMEILIEFSDGEIVKDNWDGKGRVKVYDFARDAKVVRAAIDPENKVLLDVNRLNNGKRVEENEAVTNKYMFKGFFWMQSLLQFFSL